MHSLPAQRKRARLSIPPLSQLRCQRHAEMSKKEITDAATVGAEPTGRRKANSRTWVQRHARRHKGKKKLGSQGR